MTPFPELHNETLYGWNGKMVPLAKVVATARPAHQLNAMDFVKSVAYLSGVSVANILGPVRRREITDSRFLAMYLAYKHTGMGYPTIGKELNRDHTTIMNGVRRYPDRALRRPVLKYWENRIERSLGLNDEGVSL